MCHEKKLLVNSILGIILDSYVWRFYLYNSKKSVTEYYELLTDEPTNVLWKIIG